MRGKVTNRAEALARGLKTLLATTDGDEEIFKSAFRFKSKGHVCETIARTWERLGFVDIDERECSKEVLLSVKQLTPFAHDV